MNKLSIIFSKTLIPLCILAATGAAAQPPAESAQPAQAEQPAQPAQPAEPVQGPTWQQANQRSAKLIAESGPSTEAADFARTAFELYPAQTQKYDAAVHAQLLLNLADTRRKAEGVAPALREIEAGAKLIESSGGAKTPELVAIWQEAAKIAGASADPYRERA